MNLATLLEQVSRPCTTFEVGGFRPTNEIEESWLGRVSHYLPDEDVPLDKHGNRMMELGQFYLQALPHIPASLSGFTLLTAFISPELEGDSDLMDGCFAIREYREIAGLVRKEFKNDGEGLKPFPLRSELVATDHPVWDGGGLTSEQEDAFLALESNNQISNYYDVTSHVYGHKFGGFPSFCQSGVDLHPHEFVFQISSDAKIQLNVIDNGSLTFWRHPELGTWKIYYDFY
ncbi:DUF1963 domain-containing protein [Verrucomicrobiaceae bacterium 5K15]|uniref:DUF1963 domain-containing protein n=1 Tax=Oceaniferula flava TaxID=2800421 RepID=A0AAE2SA36_9BACT|nr:DUF1963 domain-containing protein [Oceaniferula flavus]MBK1853744.1 DUF1963 domain-containing protein [Oceaniferula flavus]MBM1135051.1 DUF1963 domain-containing protein [Oceaniferula flavus]